MSIPILPDPDGSSFGLLSERMLFYKRDGSGYFLQHPLDKVSDCVLMKSPFLFGLSYVIIISYVQRYWIEYSKKHPERATCFKGDKSIRIGSKYSSKLFDVSVPLHKSSVFTMDVTPVAAQPKSSEEWIDVGQILSTNKKGKVRARKLVCHRDSGCMYDVPKVEQLRTLHKLNGGAIKEVADGQAWVESNSDGGPWLFHFGTVLSTPEFVLMLDPSRDIWLKIKPPPPLPGAPFTNSRVFMGQVGKGKRLI